MVVFLLAYGVAQQAILYPNQPASWSVVSGVFFRPYFQVYGELFVEAPDTSETDSLRTTEIFICDHVYPIFAAHCFQFVRKTE